MAPPPSSTPVTPQTSSSYPPLNGACSIPSQLKDVPSKPSAPSPNSTPGTSQPCVVNQSLISNSPFHRTNVTSKPKASPNTTPGPSQPASAGIPNPPFNSTGGAPQQVVVGNKQTSSSILSSDSNLKPTTPQSRIAHNDTTSMPSSIDPKSKI